MKGGGGGGGVGPAKRRWRFLAVGVLFLVVLSMLVPLGFLLGLHNGFHSAGFVPRPHTTTSGDRSNHVDNLVRKLGPTLPKDILKHYVNEAKNETSSANATRKSQKKKGTPVPPQVVLQPLGKRNISGDGGKAGMKGGIDEGLRLCELQYGSYCIWHEENREDMKDSMVKKLKDQLFVARAYYPSVAKIPAQNALTRDLRQNIQELERILSESTTDADLPPEIQKKSERMEATIAKSKSVTTDCHNVDKKLRQIFDLTEDEANFHMKQSAFLYQLAVQTMPKSQHCLSMRLTVEYFRDDSFDQELPVKYSDPTLQHYVIFSTNVIASTVVINSTVMHARDSMNQVFHVLTNGQNYYAMKHWFLGNTFKDAIVEVLNIDPFIPDYYDKTTPSHLNLPTEFRVSFHGINNASAMHSRTQYISIFSHSHYLLPEIFKNLEKVVVLDDDVVVQQDLSTLWSLNMGQKVMGAIQICSVRLGQVRSYLGESNFHKNSCTWMSGLNVIDLARWRKLGISETYWKLVKEQVSKKEGSAALASLLSFQGLIYALDNDWVLSGLGHDYELSTQSIKKAAVLHYNGNMKPWLELGIPKYKVYWRKFLNPENQFLNECNVNP
ncbi:putative galacturonosyltransferase 7 [Gossypium arboreum]|uniref:Hexosyltransferase n=1 Tax=Gossypium arboreum TaxID=29729 RepID=A0A0B0NCB0_GOSAR|nr:probable galacturonosyltransferase 7 isoform X1 [Gossypium arboreum]KHG10480.1 putative galacturonosyltransferase 7 [Gossypium arboreum]